MGINKMRAHSYFGKEGYTSLGNKKYGIRMLEDWERYFEQKRYPFLYINLGG